MRARDGRAARPSAAAKDSEPRARPKNPAPAVAAGTRRTPSAEMATPYTALGPALHRRLRLANWGEGRERPGGEGENERERGGRGGEVEEKEGRRGGRRRGGRWREEEQLKKERGRRRESHLRPHGRAKPLGKNK